MSPDAPRPIVHPALEIDGVRHGFFTRQGGASTGLYAGLNCGVGSADDPARVAENRARVALAMGGGADDLAAPYQTHSAIVHVADEGWRGRRPEGDAVVTRTAGVICAVLTADCAPVLLADARAGVVGATHAGWKGALGGVIEATVAAMADLGARPDRIVAVVGPCIAQASYEVGADFERRFLAEDPQVGRFFAPGATEDRRRFDLPAYVMGRLARAGVARAAWTGQDTAADPARFFSNRRAFLTGEPDFGRQMSAISLATSPPGSLRDRPSP